MDKLKQLLEVGNIGFYKTFDGGYGVSLDFYDDSYSLSVPGDSIEEAIDNMLTEWRVEYKLKSPKQLKKDYSVYKASLEEEVNEIEL